MLEKGAVVRSLAGRDKGKLLAVVESGNETCLVCDGKERPVARPKRKNVRHLEAAGVQLGPDEISTNKALRRALRTVSETVSDDTQEVKQ